MSFLVVLNSQTSAGTGRAVCYGCCCKFKDCPAVASDFPSCITVLIPADKFKECQSVYLLPGKVFEVSCVCHIKFIFYYMYSTERGLDRHIS